MNIQELESLSNKVADIFHIDANTYNGDTIIKWLHEDLERVMRLSIVYKIDITHSVHHIWAENLSENCITEVYDNYDTPEQATIVAVLKALLLV
jgi:hypothetical protein